MSTLGLYGWSFVHWRRQRAEAWRFAGDCVRQAEGVVALSVPAKLGVRVSRRVR